MNLAPVGHAIAGPTGEREESDRRTRADEDEVLQPIERAQDHLPEIGEPLDRRPSGAPLETRRERVAYDARAGALRDAAREDELRRAQGAPVEQER